MNQSLPDHPPAHSVRFPPSKGDIYPFRYRGSGTSPGIHYGEAQAAESRRDFIHKMKVILKELREIRGNLIMSSDAKLISSDSAIEPIIDECSQLIAIFVKSIQTAERKRGEPEK